MKYAYFLGFMSKKETRDGRIEISLNDNKTHLGSKQEHVLIHPYLRTAFETRASYYRVCSLIPMEKNPTTNVVSSACVACQL